MRIATRHGSCLIAGSLLILRLLRITDRHGGRGGRALLLSLIRRNRLTPDGVVDAVVILSAAQKSIHVHTHTGIDTVKLSHLVAGELD